MRAAGPGNPKKGAWAVLLLGAPLRMSEKGRDWLALLEGGYQLKAYQCPSGAWTISAGVTYYSPGNRVQAGDTLPSIEAARELFAKVLAEFEAGVDSLTRDDLRQNEFDALVSFVYNIGPSAYRDSRLARLVNETAPHTRIHREFMRWVFAAGKKSEGLRLRRMCESTAYGDGLYIDQAEARKYAC